MLLNVDKLLTVLSFYRLRSDDLRSFQFIYPFALTALITASYFAALYAGVEVDSDKIISSINTLMAALVGFFIAALAAVTGLGNEKLNNVMSGNAPRFPAEGGGYIYTTRRRFLTIVIGYCAFVAIVVFILGSLAISVNIYTMNYEIIQFMVGYSWFISYLWLLSSLITVTMLCLHYLIDRAHR